VLLGTGQLASAQTTDWTKANDELMRYFQVLIRIDSQDPPGNETAAAELLRDYLAANGVEGELIARTPERANLVARIPGGDGPSLLFLGHTDVVLADPGEWSVPPFSGELRDGMVWGRGALDMKSQVAANAVALSIAFVVCIQRIFWPSRRTAFPVPCLRRIAML